MTEGSDGLFADFAGPALCVPGVADETISLPVYWLARCQYNVTEWDRGLCCDLYSKCGAPKAVMGFFLRRVPQCSCFAISLLLLFVAQTVFLLMIYTGIEIPLRR